MGYTIQFNIFVVFLDLQVAEYAAKDPEAGYEVIGKTDPYSEYWTINECDMIRNFHKQHSIHSVIEILPGSEDEPLTKDTPPHTPLSLLESVSSDLSKKEMKLQDICEERKVSDGHKTNSSRQAKTAADKLLPASRLILYQNADTTILDVKDDREDFVLPKQSEDEIGSKIMCCQTEVANKKGTPVRTQRNTCEADEPKLLSPLNLDEDPSFSNCELQSSETNQSRNHLDKKPPAGCVDYEDAMSVYDCYTID